MKNKKEIIDNLLELREIKMGEIERHNEIIGELKDKIERKKKVLHLFSNVGGLK